MTNSKSIEVISESDMSSKPVSESRKNEVNNISTNEGRRENRFLLKTIISLREHEEQEDYNYVPQL
jgi:hypothetical protein